MWLGHSDAIVHSLLCDRLVLWTIRSSRYVGREGSAAGMTSLKHVQRPPHVTTTELDQTVDRIGRDLYVLFHNHSIDQPSDIGLLERAEPETGATRQ